MCTILNEYFSRVFTDEGRQVNDVHLGNTEVEFRQDPVNVLLDIVISDEVVLNCLNRL